MIFIILFSLLTIIIYFIYINIFFHKMSFMIFAKKIIRKLYKLIFKRNLYKEPVGENSIYSQVNDLKNFFFNTGDSIILNIPTSDKSNQAVHPDVIYIENGFGYLRKKYWMVCTPYPNQDDRFENPEVFSSEDGFFWSQPQKDINPIIQKPKDFLSHNSDASILFNEKKLTVFFRTSFYEKNINTNKIYSINSDDGVNWKDTKLLMESKSNLFLSPVVKKINNEWVMWLVDYKKQDKSSLVIYRKTSNNLIDWTNTTEVPCHNLPQGNMPWHIGVEIFDKTIFCFLTSCKKLGGKKSINWLARSEDLGNSFQVIRSFDTKYKFENWFQYRGSMIYSHANNKIQIFYSAVDKNNISYIVRSDQTKDKFYE